MGVLLNSVLITALAVPATAQNATQGAAPRSAGAPSAERIRELVAASHVLHRLGLMDGYGHVSVRHDKDPNRFLMSRSMGPEFITSDDIMEFDLDSTPVDQRGRQMHGERFIHSSIYKARPDVQAVVHTHAPALVLMSVIDDPMRPIYHMAGFIGQGIPVFDIRPVAGLSDMLISDGMRGAALAKGLSDKPAVLMRGHGVTVVGESVGDAVARTYYLTINATLQQQAAMMSRKIQFLAPEEAAKADMVSISRKNWEMWMKEDEQASKRAEK